MLSNEHTEQNVHPISDSISDGMPGNAWALATKSVGDVIAGWLVEQRYGDDTRILNKSERCRTTSFCYPTGAKLVRVQLIKKPRDEFAENQWR